MDKINILIADDHAIVRQGLKQILAETSDIVVSDEAGNGHEVLEKLSKGMFDVIVLDISMPGPNGLDILKRIKVENPQLPVLILSMHAEEQYAVRALRAGASGYLTKETAPDELIAAIRKVSTGGRYVSPALAERLAFDVGKDKETPLHEHLSDREYQITCMIAKGKRIKDIAEELYLSPKTVSSYRYRILDR